MKRSVVAVTIAVLFILAGFAGRVLAQADVVAAVNSEPITRSALIERLLGQSTLGQGMLEVMIGETLLAQYAKKKGVQVTDQEVQARVAEMRKAQSEADFKESLLANQLTEKGLPVFVRPILLVERLFGDQANVTDEQVRRVYDENKQLFNRPATVRVRVLETRTEAEAKAARQRVAGGEVFEAVARAVSVHLPTRAGGGLLGPARKEDLEQLFKGAGEAAFSLKVGEVSQPVKGEDGWWLFKVEASAAAVNPSFDDVKEQIRATMRQNLLRAAYGKWLSQAMRDPANKIERKL
jgi:foldase protein PrsA